MDRALYLALLESPFLQDCLVAYASATGLPLRFLPAEATKDELSRALSEDPFMAIVMRTREGEAACLNPILALSARLRDDLKPTEARNVCGLIHAGVPLIVDRPVPGMLLAGPISEKIPDFSDCKRVTRWLTNWGLPVELQDVRTAYCAVPVVPSSRRKSAITLLSLLADQLAEFTNRWLLTARECEPHCVAVAKTFIQKHAFNRLTQEVVARHVGVSPDYFGKIFKKSTHLTFGGYISRVRLEHVREMLAKPSCRVVEAAFASGFQSVSQFNRVFKKHTGANPSQYRFVQRQKVGAKPPQPALRKCRKTRRKNLRMRRRLTRSLHNRSVAESIPTSLRNKQTKKERLKMHFNSKLRTFSLAAVFGCSTLLSFGVASAQNALAPATTLDVAPATIVDAQSNYVMQQPAPAREIPFRPTMSRTAYDAAKARAANSYGPGAVKPFAAASSPLVAPFIKTTKFNGHSSTEGLRPPDTHGAVGTTHFVEVTNSHIDMYERNADPTILPLAKSVRLAMFFGYTAETLFDPRVVYDSTWNRWIVTAEAFPESSTVQRFFIAVSTGPNPTGAFYIYDIDVDVFNNDDFFDFPQLGMDQDAVLFTANIFNSGDAFVGADFFAVAKARLYNGLGFSVPLFTGLVGTLAPPIVLDQNVSTFLIAAPTSGTTFRKYTATNTSKAFAMSLTGPVTISVPSYSIPPNAHQPGTTDKLDTSDSRFVNASTQNGVDLWQTHTIALGSFPAPKFYRLNTSTNAVTQSGFYFASGTSDDFNASIAANAAGHCFVTYTSTDAGSGINAQVRLSGKLNADASISAGPPGATSLTFYDASADTTERWGDYSAVTTDPKDTASAWLVNEKVNPNGFLWGSRIIKFGF